MFQHSLGTTGGRLVCLQSYQTAGQVFQLEARPPSRGSRCLQTELVRRVRQSPMGSSRQVSTTCSTGGGYYSAGDTVLADASMVSSSFPTAPRLPETSSRHPRSIDTAPSRVQDSSPRRSQPVGRLVHLRESYQSAGLSEDAVKLLLASWRFSMTKIYYNSSWRKWELWYSRSNTNPISPTLGDILASEYTSGRCYRSPNCYRSALSLVPAPIDGRHPLVYM